MANDWVFQALRSPPNFHRIFLVTAMSTIVVCLLVIGVGIYLLVAMLWPEKF